MNKTRIEKTKKIIASVTLRLGDRNGLCPEPVMDFGEVSAVDKSGKMPQSALKNCEQLCILRDKSISKLGVSNEN